MVGAVAFLGTVAWTVRVGFCMIVLSGTALGAFRSAGWVAAEWARFGLDGFCGMTR